jgi:hypothetical protein
MQIGEILPRKFVVSASCLTSGKWLSVEVYICETKKEKCVKMHKMSLPVDILIDNQKTTSFSPSKAEYGIVNVEKFWE